MVHMPARNTPQFSECLSRMPRKLQPVPPVFQPEVSAEAVYWATHSREREVMVGWPERLDDYRCGCAGSYRRYGSIRQYHAGGQAAGAPTLTEARN
jgi:hypothetical protein